jgi:hypothetical protein
MSTPSPSGPFIPPPTPSLIPFGPLAASTAAPQQYRVLSNRVIGLAALVLIVVGVGLAILLLILFGNGKHADQLAAVQTAGTIVVGTGGAAALWLTARRQRATEIALNQAKDAHGLQQQVAEESRAHQQRVAAATESDAEARRITDLYTKAIEQLGSDKAPVRLGGLYALARVAQDNIGQRQTIVNVLCAYLRMPYTPPTDQAQGGNALEPEQAARTQEQQVRVTAQDIIAAHLRPGYDPSHPDPTFWPDITLDLSAATLIDFDMTYCTLRTARFGRAQFLGKSRFGGASFAREAWFSRARFAGTAWFRDTAFAGSAGFVGAQFADTTWFDGARFDSDVSFREARFAGGAQFDPMVKFDMGGCWVRMDVPDTVTDDRIWPTGLRVGLTTEQPPPDVDGDWGRLIGNTAPASS